MIRSDLARTLKSENPDLPGDAIDKLLDAFFDSIAQRLAEGGRVELRGFGAFSTRSRGGRVARNPRSGDAVVVASKRVPHFRPGKSMRDLLANAGDG